VIQPADAAGGIRQHGEHGLVADADRDHLPGGIFDPKLVDCSYRRVCECLDSYFPSAKTGAVPAILPTAESIPLCRDLRSSQIPPAKRED
jgi:hypothetical protein